MQPSIIVRLDSLNGAGAHDRTSMDLPEHLRIQAPEELAERCADMDFILRSHDAHILVLRLEEQYFVDTERLRHGADAARDPANLVSTFRAQMALQRAD